MVEWEAFKSFAGGEFTTSAAYPKMKTFSMIFLEFNKSLCNEIDSLIIAFLSDKFIQKLRDVPSSKEL